MDSSSVASYVSVVISLMAVILGIINHKRIRSSCCGKEASVSLDIEATTPPTQKSEPLVYNGTAERGEIQESKPVVDSRKGSESEASR
jgi:hypothetical protein